MTQCSVPDCRAVAVASSGMAGLCALHREPSTGYATLDEIIAIYWVTRSYAYRIACEHRWHRYRHPNGGVRYRRDDVDASLAEGAETRRLRVIAKRSIAE